MEELRLRGLEEGDLLGLFGRPRAGKGKGSRAVGWDGFKEVGCETEESCDMMCEQLEGMWDGRFGTVYTDMELNRGVDGQKEETKSFSPHCRSGGRRSPRNQAKSTVVCTL